MRLLADWWDPGANGFDIGDVGLIIGVLLSTIGLGTLTVNGVRRYDRWRNTAHEVDVKAIMSPVIEEQTKYLLEQVGEMTQLIKLGYRNEGTSITDISIKVDDALATAVLNGRAVDQISTQVAEVQATQETIQAAQADILAERAQILSIAEANTQAIKTAVTGLGAHVELIPFTPDPAGEDHPA